MKPELRVLGREEEKRPSRTRLKNNQPTLNNKADIDVFTSVWRKCKRFFQKSFWWCASHIFLRPWSTGICLAFSAEPFQGSDSTVLRLRVPRSSQPLGWRTQSLW